MNLDYFKEQRIVIKDCLYPQFNGKTTIISKAIYKEIGILLCTDLPHPDEPETLFWITLSEIAYIKKFAYYFIQYRDKYGQTINKPFSDDDNGTLKINGNFDVYIKVFPPFNTLL